MELVTAKMADIKPYIRNPRKNAAAVDAVAESIKQCSYIAPIIVDEDNVILAGHTRYKALKKLGYTECEIIVKAGLSEEQKRKYRILDNKTNELAEWDLELLNIELTGLDFDGFDFGLDTEEPEEPEIVEDEAPEIDEDAEPVAKLGDIWQLGRHRLMCGDSTDKETVKRLLDGAKADMVFTDPPYGVNVKGGKGKGNLIMGDLTQTAIPFSFEIACEVATKEKAHFYFCGGESNLQLYQKLFDRYLHMLPKHLIWVKNGFVMKQNGYHNQFEIIFHGYKQGSGAMWFGGRTEHEASDVWQIKRDSSASYVHPTQKPVDLPARAIKNSSPKGAVVFEPFCGSGSTLLACEQLERVCYAMELDPKYVDVIINRWETFTGEKAVLLNG